MNASLKITNQRIKIILMALAAAATHSTNAQSEYLTLKRFVEAHPEQVFVLSVLKERGK